MLLTEELFRTTYKKLMRQAMMDIPEDVDNAYQRMLQEEDQVSQGLIKEMLEGFAENRQHGLPPCYDSGTITYYTMLGTNVSIQPGLDFDQILAEITKELTDEGVLRATNLNPLTRHNPNTNVGENMPHHVIKFHPGDFVEMTAVGKGGGGSAFGSAFTVLQPSEGEKGVKKVVFDAIVNGAIYGKICPPAIVGVGIGGSISNCLTLAEEAAVLRPVGSRNPAVVYRRLEEELLTGINMTGIGYMGLGGRFTVTDLHIEFGLTHSAMLPVGVVANCLAMHRRTARITADGQVHDRAYPAWFREV